jgi:flavin-dependent dehydrogenase
MSTVAIIGGGPAGATAAEQMARAGAQYCSAHGLGTVAQHQLQPLGRCQPALRGCPKLPERVRLGRGIGADTHILLFEERPGWEKPCGGGLPYQALQRFPFLLEASDPHTRIHDVELVAANGEGVRFRLCKPLAIYARAALNKLLLRRAAEAGAQIVHDRILDFSRSNGSWHLAGRRSAYKADFLVLAAGARTQLRARLAPHFRAHDFMLTFGYYAPIADELLRVQFFEDLEGYAWSFPRTDHLSLGICGKADQNKMPELRERLHEFMERFGYKRFGGAHGEPAPVFSHLLPALSPESWHTLSLAGPGWALAGDAAGLVDPITGEGIYFAMRSGELLAESLLAGAPESYPERLWQDFGRKLALGARLARLFYQGDFLGQPSTTRLVQLAGRSQAFMDLLESLIEGSLSYARLASRLYAAFGKALVEIVAGTVRDHCSELNSTP